MIYYRVKKEADQTPRVIWKRPKQQFIKNGIFVMNELYTVNELKPYYFENDAAFNKIFEKINVNKFKTYCFFGARFEMEE